MSPTPTGGGHHRHRDIVAWVNELLEKEELLSHGRDALIDETVALRVTRSTQALRSAKHWPRPRTYLTAFIPSYRRQTKATPA